MIKVTQGILPDQFNLNNPSSKAFIETEKAKLHFSHGLNQNQNFIFNAYRCDSLKKVLKSSFNGKCGYCESYITHIGAMEIEHYRPKKAVKINNNLVYPGYYWLAADFQNLLPACPACNQLRRYELEDGTCSTSGKGNNFPIKCESKRAKIPGDEIHEIPRLLHPYNDLPHEHLKFSNTGMIHYKTTKGKFSIEIYALKRLELVPRRKEVIAGIKVDICNIVDAIKSIIEANSLLQIQRHKSAFNRNHKSLRKRMCSNSAYSAVARDLLHEEKVLKDLKKWFKKELNKACERINTSTKKSHVDI